ncbi:MAG: pyridoxal phosphate-dependent aminotransferase [Acidobacteria bacterium]|jgi:aspartate aminotransferase|nr:pyridoxal phosphate-dependent aminotransferase [Acidobacteriota bacterium]
MNTAKPVSLNLNLRGMGQSATLAINEQSRLLREQGQTVFAMGLGQSPFPVPESVIEALRLAAAEKDYLPVKGLPALREAVANFHRNHEQIDANPDGVIIGPGSKELMFLLQLTFYGEIIVTSPCWVSYLPQARIIGRTVSVIPRSFEQKWKLTAEQLTNTLEGEADDYRPRLLVLNYPGNPTGQSYSADELEQIAEVARRFGVIILSDEIYGHLHHRGEHVSIARFYPEGTIVSSGLSKWCGAGGWRLGTFYFPPDLGWLLEALTAVASETYTSVCAPIQHAAVHAFRCGVDIERYLWHARRILSALASQCTDMLRQAGLGVHLPDGAFYLFVDFTPIRERLAARDLGDGPSLCKRLLMETGVAILPGASFARSPQELTARLAYVNFDGARALAASQNTPLDQELPPGFPREYCEDVLVGVERLVEWVGAES